MGLGLVVCLSLGDYFGVGLFGSFDLCGCLGCLCWFCDVGLVVMGVC